MSSEFVPLIPASAPVSTASVSAAKIKMSKPSGHALARPATSPPEGQAAPALDAGQAITATAPGGQPQVDLQREGDRITAIKIRCGCGQVIELSCLYE